MSSIKKWQRHIRRACRTWWKKWSKAWRGTTSVKCRWVFLYSSNMCITVSFLATVQSNMCFSTFLQGRMFSCSAECCSRPSDSMSQVHQCIDRCHTPLAQAQGLVTSELEKFQVRGVQFSTCANDAFPVSIRLISSLSKKRNTCLKNYY